MYGFAQMAHDRLEHLLTNPLATLRNLQYASQILREFYCEFGELITDILL